MKSLLGWGTDKWTREYLGESAGDALVSVERRRKFLSSESQANTLFGFGMNICRKFMHFKDFLSRYYSDVDNSETESSSSEEIWDEYLNIQALRDKNSTMWRPPLYMQPLREDIPTPAVLAQYMDRGDLQDVSLWMGRSQSSGGIMKTRI